MDLEMERKFRCPHCGERVSMLLDLSEDGSHTYVEDCEVCCKPIQIAFEAAGGELVTFGASA
jgi:transcription elongation factor Elf1